MNITDSIVGWVEQNETSCLNLRQATYFCRYIEPQKEGRCIERNISQY